MPASEEQRRVVAERRLRALRLRAAGATYQQIAEQLGHKTPAAAVQDVTRALRVVQGQLAEQAQMNLTLELVRLDDLERAAQILLHAATTPGRNQDPGLALRVMDRLERIGRRRADLLGLTTTARRGGDKSGGREREPDRIDDIAEQRRKRRSRYAAHG